MDFNLKANRSSSLAAAPTSAEPLRSGLGSRGRQHYGWRSRPGAGGESCRTCWRKNGAASIQVIKTDVTDFDQVNAMFKAATDKHGTVDVLVNNVGWIS